MSVPRCFFCSCANKLYFSFEETTKKFIISSQLLNSHFNSILILFRLFLTWLSQQCIKQTSWIILQFRKIIFLEEWWQMIRSQTIWFRSRSDSVRIEPISHFSNTSEIIDEIISCRRDYFSHHILLFRSTFPLFSTLFNWQKEISHTDKLDDTK